MQEILQTHQKQLEQIFKQEGVALAYLFGSQARGTTHHFSDTDIAVLFDNTVSQDQHFKKTLQLMLKLGELLQTEHVDVVDLNRAKPLLRYQAVFGGKLLFTRSRAVQVFFENRVMKEYQDTKHIFQLSFGAMKERIKKGTFGINPHFVYGSGD